MKEQFITYEIALKLKELGFDEGCLAYYGDNILIFDKHEYLECDIKANYVLGWKNQVITLAPLWQQVIDWFREKYNIHITINPNLKFNTEIGEALPKDLTYRVIFDNRFYLTWSDNKIPVLCFDLSKGYNFKSYNEAKEQAILKAIELITQQV